LLQAGPAAEQEEVEWEDVQEPGNAKIGHDNQADTGGGRDSLDGNSHWRARAAVRQRFWSTSHGFAMGRKLGDWERHTGEQKQETKTGNPGGAFPKSPATGLPWGGVWGLGVAHR